MKKLMVRTLFIAMLLPVFSVYSQNLTWTFGSSAMGVTAGIDAGDFQIQLLANKYSPEVDVSLTTTIPGLPFNVTADQFSPTGVISSITTYAGVPVLGSMTGFNSFDLQADTYKFFGTDFCIYFKVTANETTYFTDELCYVYTGSGNASLSVGIDELLAAPSKKCDMIISENKISVKLSSDTHDAVAHITDMLGKVIYDGSVTDAIDISDYSKGVYIISVSDKEGTYCNSKFLKN